ncbi:aspartate aminotransferase [Trypanosoma brucei equiperdum]|uniref:aspartate transaminase n=1 Tax=Trypanosoma brucei equiperdum TaxID=630700 RepID=A0A3L6KW61_9TRYP|nr:aspartate aminotransferase [Trypanosoma brucei equiperdum]
MLSPTTQRHIAKVGMESQRAIGSVFSNIPMGKPDPILGLGQDFRMDPAKRKVNLSIGVYRDDADQPFVLECVKQATLGTNMDYAPVTGIASFVEEAQKLCFGPTCAALRDGRIASCQTLGGTGALRIGGDLLNRFVANCNRIYGPDVGYPNHESIFAKAGMELTPYSYYDPATKGLNLAGMLECLDKAPEGSVILVHACAHNPTGVDPTHDDWRQVCDVIKRRNHIPFVDMAYQGFATGQLDYDAFVPRHLVDMVPNLIVAQSFSKNFGLYGHRCGALHISTASAEEAKRLVSQLALLIRPMYSNPPLYGAWVVSSILKDPQLTALWKKELKQMSSRIAEVRKRLVSELKACGSVHDWSHIERQVGMMAYTGLTREQVELLRSEYHIYMTLNGRAAVSGLNSTNVEYVSQAIHNVTK